jgi:hypothetical protein
MGRREMIELAVRHRTDECQPIDALRQPREMLADLNARNGSINCLELAPNFRRGLWFEIERIVVAGAATQENQEHSLGTRFQSGLIGTGSGACGQQVLQTNPRQAGETDLQQLSSRDPNAMASIPTDVHEGRLSFREDRIGRGKQECLNATDGQIDHGVKGRRKTPG